MESQNPPTKSDSDSENNNKEVKNMDISENPASKKMFPLNILEKSTMLKNLQGDFLHVCILFFLYCLQGIPLGLKSSIPLILTRRSVPYADQATFSISGYPFSMKVLWAPIIDSVFWAKFGRRKSWLVPVQYLIGITMLIASQYVSTLLGDKVVTDNGNITINAFNETDLDNFSNSTSSGLDTDEDIHPPPDVGALTAMFFILYFLAATQDVAVDGWALTMLKPINVGYAATCNAVGQQTGWVLGFVVFTSLEAAGLVTLDQFFLFWGIVFLITTTGICFFMKEKNKSHESTESTEDDENQEPDLGFFEAYIVLWKILKHPLVLVMIGFLFTTQFPFSAAEDMVNLQLIDQGVPSERIAQLSIPMIPVKVITTFVVTKFTVGKKPFNAYIYSYPFRLLLCLGLVALVYIAPLMKQEDDSFPAYFYALIIAVFAIHRAVVYAMFVSMMAFFARVSDPVVGGTYMTLLNTLANLGGMWPNSFSLWFVDQVTYKTCQPLNGTDLTHPLEFLHNHTIISPRWEENNCYGTKLVEKCKADGGECITLSNGFYAMSIAWVCIGAVWLIWGWRTVKNLQLEERDTWRVIKKKGEAENQKKEERRKFNYFYCF